MKYAPYTYSKMACYEKCARQFYYHYVLKIKIPFIESEHLYKGSFTHLLLENTPFDYDINHIDSIVDKTAIEVFKTSGKKFKDKTKEEIDEYIEMADRVFRTAISVYHRYLGSDVEQRNNYLRKKNKHEVEISFDNMFKQSGYWDDNTFYRGKIDLVTHENNKIELIDWKTGKYKDIRWQDFNQLVFYAIFFFMNTNVDEIRVSFNYVEHNAENSLTLNRKYLNNYLKPFLTMIKNMEYDTEFKKSPSKLCQYCNFKETCDKSA